MRTLLLVIAMLAGCGFTLPSSRTVVTRGEDGTTVESTQPLVYGELCVDAVQSERAWRATSIVFSALGTATSGAVVTSEFLSDEEWVVAAFSIGGIVFGGVGLASGLVADDAAQDVLLYCGTPVE